MTDTGKTILVERKFSIYSQFLDVVLQSESAIQEGESRKDALLRVHRELEETAAELRKKTMVDLGEGPVYHANSSGPLPVVEVEFRNGQQDTLDGIRSSQTLDELSTYRKLSNNNQQLYGAYCKRLKELSNA